MYVCMCEQNLPKHDVNYQKCVHVALVSLNVVVEK